VQLDIEKELGVELGEPHHEEEEDAEDRHSGKSMHTSKCMPTAQWHG